MPIEIRDLDGGRGVRITASGVVTEEEFTEAFRSHLSQDPEKFRRYRFSVSDYRGVTDLQVPTQAVRWLADLCKRAAEVNPDVVVATVARRDLVFGLGRMWELLTDGIGWETRVFKTIEEARFWVAERIEA